MIFSQIIQFIASFYATAQSALQLLIKFQKTQKQNLIEKNEQINAQTVNPTAVQCFHLDNIQRNEITKFLSIELKSHTHNLNLVNRLMTILRFFKSNENINSLRWISEN